MAMSAAKQHALAGRGRFLAEEVEHRVRFGRFVRE
jgi:hypothetical protein